MDCDEEIRGKRLAPLNFKKQCFVSCSMTHETKHTSSTFSHVDANAIV